MRKIIVAIGGGEIRARGTALIDREMTAGSTGIASKSYANAYKVCKAGGKGSPHKYAR
jgi:hypothetical protein